MKFFTLFIIMTNFLLASDNSLDDAFDSLTAWRSDRLLTKSELIEYKEVALLFQKLSQKERLLFVKRKNRTFEGLGDDGLAWEKGKMLILFRMVFDISSDEKGGFGQGNSKLRLLWPLELTKENEFVCESLFKGSMSRYSPVIEFKYFSEKFGFRKM